MDRNLFQQRRSDYIANKNIQKKNISIFNQLQDTQYIVPADNMSLIGKAVNFGCSKALELLTRYGISVNDLAEYLDSSPEIIQNIIRANFHADLILIDGEDATLLSEENIRQSRSNAVEVCNARKNYSSLIYYRPSGIDIEYCIDDVVDVLEGINVTGAGVYPLDGIIYPKVESVQEIRIILDLITEIEKKKNISPDTIKIQFLVESPGGIEFLYEIAKACEGRLTGIIFGMADYASEIGISSLDENHPMFQFAKQRIIHAASIFQVPAIDCMSFNYPVADKTIQDVHQNRKLILESMRDLHDLYISSIHMGMSGKWVGHPLQLLAAKIAVEKIFTQETINSHLQSMLKYADSGSGAMVVDGKMADRATDRSIRSFLRKGVIKGKINPDIALQSGLISQAEFDIIVNRGRRDSNPRLPA